MDIVFQFKVDAVLCFRICLETAVQFYVEAGFPFYHLLEAEVHVLVALNFKLEQFRTAGSTNYSTLVFKNFLIWKRLS